MKCKSCGSPGAVLREKAVELCDDCYANIRAMALRDNRRWVFNRIRFTTKKFAKDCGKAGNKINKKIKEKQQ